MTRWLRALEQSPRGVLWDVTLNAGSGGVTAKTDVVGGVHTQVLKLQLGAPTVEGGLVGPANPIPVRETGATSALANVGALATNVTVLASNANRLRAWLYNDSDKTAYVKFGVTATTGSFTKKLLPEEFFTVEGYTGIVDAIWEAGPTGNMRTTELTA